MTLFQQILQYHIEDSKKNNNIQAGEWPPKDFRVKNFIPREGWRFGSLIVWSTTLEYIIKKDFKAKQDLYNKISSKKKRFNKEMRNREKEFKPLKKSYRHKVYGHSAYGQSRNDSKTFQATSLNIFTNRATSFNKDSGDIQYGSQIIRVGDEEIRADEKFPILTFKKLCENLHDHYLEWFKMYSELLERFYGIAESEYKDYFKNEGYSIDSISKR